MEQLEKCAAFVELAYSSGQQNRKLAREWYRSLPKNLRDTTHNENLVQEFLLSQAKLVPVTA